VRAPRGARGDRAVAGADRRVADLAAEQAGNVSVAQLRACGLSADAIKHRVRTGRLHRRHRGVYAVGHLAAPPFAREWAAVLACPAAVLSHGTAAVLWGLLEADEAAPVHVTLPGGRHHRDGIRVHRARLEPGDVRHRHGLPLTSPARTILDLAPQVTERLLADALARRLVRPGDLRKSARLRGLLDPGPRLTRSEAERRLLAIVERARLPRPRTNARVAGFELDAFWPHARLAVEVDGYAFHGSRTAFERDRRRDLALHAAGVRVLRVSWRQLGEPEALSAALAAALARVERPSIAVGGPPP
jgi:very-short-patch-repair endonuclease